MNRIFFALVLLSLSLPVRAATGLSSVLMTNLNKRHFIVDLTAAPTNIVKLNLDQQQFDTGGTTITITNINSVFNGMDATNYFLLGGTNILIETAIAGTNVTFTVNVIPVFDTLVATNLTAYNITNVFQTNVFQNYTNNIFTNVTFFTTNVFLSNGVPISIYINGTNVLEEYNPTQFSQTPIISGGLTTDILNVKIAPLITNLVNVGLFTVGGQPYTFPAVIPMGGGLLINPGDNNLAWEGSQANPIFQSIYIGGTNLWLIGPGGVTNTLQSNLLWVFDPNTGVLSPNFSPPLVIITNLVREGVSRLFGTEIWINKSVLLSVGNNFIDTQVNSQWNLLSPTNDPTQVTISLNVGITDAQKLVIFNITNGVPANGAFMLTNNTPVPGGGIVQLLRGRDWVATNGAWIALEFHSPSWYEMDDRNVFTGIGGGSGYWINQGVTLLPSANWTNYYFAYDPTDNASIVATPNRYLQGVQPLLNATVINSGNIHVSGITPMQSVTMSNLFGSFAGGNDPFDTAVMRDGHDLYAWGDHPAFHASFFGSGPVFAWEYHSFDGALVTNSSYLSMRGNYSGASATFNGSANVYGDGHSAFSGADLENSQDIYAPQGGLQGAHLTNSFKLAAIGPDAGNSQNGSLTNVLLIGSGAYAADGTTDTIMFSPSMQPVSPLGLYVGTNSQAYWSGGQLQFETLISFRNTTKGEFDAYDMLLGSGDPSGTNTYFELFGSSVDATMRFHENGLGNDANVYYIHPTEPDASGTAAYHLGTTLMHTSGNILEVANNGTNLLQFGPALMLIGKDTSHGSTLTYFDDVRSAFTMFGADGSTLGMNVGSGSVAMNLNDGVNAVVTIEPTTTDGTAPFHFGSSITHTTGNLMEVANNGTNKLTLAANSGYDGSGTHFLSDDGTYKTGGGGGGTTINTLNGFIPARLNATTFTNSGFFIPQGAGPHAISLANSGNGDTNSGPAFLTMDGDNGYALFGVNTVSFNIAPVNGIVTLLADPSNTDPVYATPRYFGALNSVGATASAPGNSPAFVWQGFGWNTNAAASQATAFAAYVEPSNAANLPSSQWSLWTSTSNNVLTRVFAVSSTNNISVGDTPVLLLDGNTLKRVSVGANDSGGAGFKVLRVAN